MSEKHSSSPLLESESPHHDDEELKDVVIEKQVVEEVKGVENDEDKEEAEAEAEEEEEEEDEDENEEEVDGDDDDDDDSGVFTVKKHVAVVPNPKPQSSSSSSSIGDEEEEEEEEEADSDLAPPPPPPPPPPAETSDNSTDVDKPITTIPMAMDASAKQKKQKKKKKKKKKYSTTTTTTTTTDQKPKTSGTVTPMKQRPSKRTASETTDKLEEEEVSKKRKMKKSSSSNGKLHWSKDDEVVILNGMLSLIRKEPGTAAKPISERINLLHENIKTSLQVDHVTMEQLYGKVRKLKQKYFKAKNHDSKILKLAKNIWGTSVKGDQETTEAINGVGGLDSAAAKKELHGKSTRSHHSKATNAVVSPKQQLHNEVPSFFNQVIESGKNSIVPPDGLKGFLTKEALGLIGSSKAKDLEKKWNKLQIAEAQIYLDRIDLVKEQVELVLDAIGGTEE